MPASAPSWLPGRRPVRRASHAEPRRPRSKARCSAPWTHHCQPNDLIRNCGWRGPLRRHDHLDSESSPPRPPRLRVNLQLQSWSCNRRVSGPFASPRSQVCPPA
jgi:hypothetical protein